MKRVVREPRAGNECFCGRRAMVDVEIGVRADFSLCRRCLNLIANARQVLVRRERRVRAAAAAASRELRGMSEGGTECVACRFETRGPGS